MKQTTRRAKKTPKSFRVSVGPELRAIKLPRRARAIPKPRPVTSTLSAARIARALGKSPGAKRLLAQKPAYAKAAGWELIATFSPCQKTGTARYLDIWDCDHFDGFTDMARNLAECRVWFADKGFTFWDSPETRTGRINCYFQAPVAGDYVCNVELQSHAGLAVVSCLIDSFSFGNLPFNGSILQPHPRTLAKGYHSFRIRQVSGAYFFNSLTVWKV